MERLSSIDALNRLSWIETRVARLVEAFGVFVDALPASIGRYKAITLSRRG